MISDFKRSLRNILDERVTSPFYGSFAFSWIIWNWRILYLTAFISQEAISPNTKLEYIEEHYLGICTLLIYPLLTSCLLIVAVPYLSNQLYRAHLFHESNRRKRKETYDSEKRLTLEKSAELRIELAEKSSHFDKVIDNIKLENRLDKEQIKLLTASNEELRKLVDAEEVNKKKFKVLSGRYGLGSTTIDVTDQLQTLQEGVPLVINNTSMGFDPVPNKQKDLYIMYQTGGKIDWLYTQEYYQLTVKDSILIAEDTLDSLRLRDTVTFQALLEYFEGEWNLEYSGSVNGSEDLMLQSPNLYCIKQADGSFKPVFELTDIRINAEEKTIYYTKNGIGKDKRMTTGILQIKVEGSLYEGIENDGETKLIYRKTINEAISEESPAYSNS